MHQQHKLLTGLSNKLSSNLHVPPVTLSRASLTQLITIPCARYKRLSEKFVYNFSKFQLLDLLEHRWIEIYFRWLLCITVEITSWKVTWSIPGTHQIFKLMKTPILNLVGGGLDVITYFTVYNIKQLMPLILTKRIPPSFCVKPISEEQTLSKK